MSSDEQDLIAGRLVREYSDLKRQLVSALTKADQDADAYSKIASYIRSKNRSSGGLRYGSPLPFPFDKLPDTEDVRKTCEEVLRIVERRREVFGSLRDMGHEPKDPPESDLI